MLEPTFVEASKIRSKIGRKLGETISVLRNFVIYEAENCGLVSIMEFISNKKSTIV